MRLSATVTLAERLVAVRLDADAAGIDWHDVERRAITLMVRALDAADSAAPGPILRLGPGGKYRRDWPSQPVGGC